MVGRMLRGIRSGNHETEGKARKARGCEEGGENMGMSNTEMTEAPVTLAIAIVEKPSHSKGTVGYKIPGRVNRNGGDVQWGSVEDLGSYAIGTVIRMEIVGTVQRGKGRTARTERITVPVELTITPAAVSTYTHELSGANSFRLSITGATAKAL